MSKQMRWLVVWVSCGLLACSGDGPAASPDASTGADASSWDAGVTDAGDTPAPDAGAPDASPFDPLEVTTSCGTPPGATYPSRLQVSAENPRYFANQQGEALYLTGLHMWHNLMDMPELQMDYCAYVEHMRSTGQNFMRLWLREHTFVDDQGNPTTPMPYVRVSGTANDGGPKYDLDQLDQAFFDRMRDRVIDAGKRGLYVAVMLFQGWSGTRSAPLNEMYPTWNTHYFNRDNNLNGIDGDPDQDDLGVEVHTLQIPEITTYQRDFVAKVIETVHDLDNVVYEVCNECEPQQETVDWANVVIDYVQSHEPATYGVEHPVVYSNTMDTAWNPPLFGSNAQAVGPGNSYDHQWPDTDGSKVVVLDTDHISPMYYINHPQFQRKWLWRQFTRGYNLWLIPVELTPTSAAGNGFELVGFTDAVDAMQRTSEWAARLDLGVLEPRSDLCTFCLVDEGATYLVYYPDGGTVQVHLSQGGDYTQEWYNPRTGATHSTSVVTLATGTADIAAPTDGPDWVLYLWR